MEKRGKKRSAGTPRPERRWLGSIFWQNERAVGAPVLKFLKDTEGWRQSRSKRERAVVAEEE